MRNNMHETSISDYETHYKSCKRTLITAFVRTMFVSLLISAGIWIGLVCLVMLSKNAPWTIHSIIEVMMNELHIAIAMFLGIVAASITEFVKRLSMTRRYLKDLYKK